MKIVCDNCATKYSIADEKVRGKVFKIRCKKCSHVIVVRGNEGGGAQPTEQSSTDLGSLNEAEETAVATSTPGNPGSGDSVWHLVIDREQVGPMTPTEVRAKFASGAVDAETYAWREGFGDWLRLGSIEDFRDLNTASPAKAEAPASAGDEGATRRTDAADVFASHQAKQAARAAEEDDGGAADLFGGSSTQAEPPTQTFTSPMAASSSTADDLFSGAPEPTRQEHPRGSSSPAPSRASASSSPLADLGSDSSNGSSSAKLTGQRNENSVLFSLNNLQALATGKGSGPSSSTGGGGGKDAPAPRPGYASAASEGSGLIDIRAMAAQTLSGDSSSHGRESSSDMPGLGASAPVFSPVVAAPILMPTPQTGMPKWVFGVIGGGVLLIGGIVAVLVVLLMRKPEVPQYAFNQPTPNNLPNTTTTGNPPPNTNPSGTTTPPTTTAKTDGTATPTTAAPDDKKPKTAKSSSSSKSSKSEKPAAKTETTTASSNPPPAKTTTTSTTTKKKGGGDDLDDLLNRASPGESKASSHKAAEPEEAMAESLTKDDVKAGLSSTTPKAKACYGTYHVPGTALAALTISKGKITAIEIKGVLAGTPTGDCVQKALKPTSFKKAKSSQSIVWPVILP